jgi:hypothetical protein
MCHIVRDFILLAPFAPPKVQRFGRQLLLSRLSTWGNLAKRVTVNVGSDSTCVWCPGSVEVEEHLCVVGVI